MFGQRARPYTTVGAWSCGVQGAGRLTGEVSAGQGPSQWPGRPDMGPGYRRQSWPLLLRRGQTIPLEAGEEPNACAELSALNAYNGRLPKGCPLNFLYVTVTSKDVSSGPQSPGPLNITGEVVWFVEVGHWPGASMRGHGRRTS